MNAARRNGLVVAIDGPSGAGKSTLTRLLAQRLGYLNIDTGAMYRTLALAVQQAGIDPDDETAVAEVCRQVQIEFQRTNGDYRVLANGVDVSVAIRTPEISLLTSRISSKGVVREQLTRLQRSMGASGGVILEGRDIGTVVFPDAEVKFFLSASVAERGRRRYAELQGAGNGVSLEQTIQEVAQRDAQDTARAHAPLRKAADAIEIDSTGLSIEEVLAVMEQRVRDCQVATGGEPWK